MSEIPEDVMAAAGFAADSMDQCIRDLAWSEIQVSIARAILAERERCTDLAMKEADECGDAVRTIDSCEFQTELQVNNRRYYAGGNRAARSIAHAIRLPSPPSKEGE